MLVFPNCKINLGLKVLDKRSDGFHNIESLMIPAGLCDILEIVESPVISIRMTGIPIDGNIDKNLVYRAYLLMKKKFSLPPIAIHLHKAIPSQAGLGGGSSDAAFMLKLLNDFFDLKLGVQELRKLSLELGSDCPFFIENRPAFVSGRGEILQGMELDLSSWYLAIIKPDVHISTAEAYSNVIRTESQVNIKVIHESPLSSWKEILYNDFENFAFEKHEEIRILKDRMYKLGAVYAAMSGSGSAVFGIFNKPPGLKQSLADIFCWEGKL